MDDLNTFWKIKSSKKVKFKDLLNLTPVNFLVADLEETSRFFTFLM